MEIYRYGLRARPFSTDIELSYCNYKGLNSSPSEDDVLKYGSNIKYGIFETFEKLDSDFISSREIVCLETFDNLASSVNITDENISLFTVFTTDVCETRLSEENIGIFSTVEKARNCVAQIIERDILIVIEETIVDEIDSGAKLEVYSFDNGLEYKSESSNAEFGSMAMVSLSSSYYEAYEIAVEKRVIPIVIEHYMRWMDDNKQNAEIEYMEVDEFLELSDTQINHVLYHAELYNEVSLHEFFKMLNADIREVA